MTTGANRPEIGLLDLLQTASDDPAATARFYRDVLGADVESESPAWSQVRLGGVDIGIHAKPASHDGWLPAFRVADVAAVKASLEQAGATILRDFHDIPGGVTLHVADSDGNALSMIQYGISTQELGT